MAYFSFRVINFDNLYTCLREFIECTVVVNMEGAKILKTAVVSECNSNNC